MVEIIEGREITRAIETGGTATFLVAAFNASNAVKHRADFVCDGIDDDVQIQAAIDALPAYAGAGGGGSVILSSGLFNIGSTMVPRGALRLSGQGVYATALYMMDGANCNMFEATGGFQLFFQLEYMYLSGNRSEQTSGSCFVAGTSLGDVHFRDVFIDIFKDKGITTGNCWGWMFDNVVVEKCGGYGIELAGNDAFLSKCKIMWNGDHNLKIWQNTSLVNCRLGPADAGIESKYALEIIAFENMITNCQINDSGYAALSHIGGIRLQIGNWSRENVIQGCTIRSKGNLYGVDIIANANRNLIIGNQFPSSGAGAINDNGTDTIKEHNIGV